MIELRVLGPPDLRRTMGEERAVHLQPKRLALLAYLTLASPSGFCRRDTLLALFWPDLDEEHARNALSQALHRLRRMLGKQAIISRGMEELRAPPAALWCDAVAFEQAIENGDFTGALDLYRGPLLDGLHVGEAPSFEHWLETERERFRRRACEAAAALADRDEAAGNLAGSAHWLRRLLDLSPDNEAVLRRLMTVLDRLGDRTGALRTYEAFTRRLVHELDLSPSPETKALFARLRTREDRFTSPEAALPSVAVLPFANLSADPEQAYFCDGMTEEIINVLAQIRGLRVAARTSVFAFRDQPVDIRALAQKLGVDAVLEGSVRRVDQRLRITAQLINAADGCHLWSERYNRPFADVFAIQDEIARSIANTLSKQLLESADGPQKPTGHLEAHTLYLKGLFHRRNRTPDDLKKACTYFQQAVRLDPDYAEAHAALAYTYTLGGWFIYDAFAPRHAYPLARDAAATALALNDRLTEAHIALGVMRHVFEWDWEGGEEALQRALALDPNDPAALGQYSSYLVLRDRIDEALELGLRLERLEPFWIGPKAYKGVWHLLARRYDVALDWLLQAQELEPRFFVAPFFLGDVYRFTGRLKEADAAYQRALDLMGRQPLILGRLGALRAAQDRPEAAMKIVGKLRALSEARYVRPAIVADIYLALGEHDEAFTWLERAYEERDTTLVLLRIYPAYDLVRSDPRFQLLLEKVGLAE